jgi:methylsterol monooxygenase
MTRPKYPTFHQPLWDFAKSLLRDSMITGTLMCLILHKTYSNLVHFLTVNLGFGQAFAFTILMNGVHSLIYFTLNGFFFVCDMFGYLKDRKLFRRNFMIPKGNLIRQAVLQALISQLITSPILTYAMFPVFAFFGLQPLNSQLPSMFDIMKTMMIAHLFNDITFYWTHRLLHTKTLYRFHKQHHEFTGTVGIAAEYAHPIEVVLSNLIPSLGGVIFFGCHHPLVVITWLVNYFFIFYSF